MLVTGEDNINRWTKNTLFYRNNKSFLMFWKIFGASFIIIWTIVLLVFVLNTDIPFNIFNIIIKLFFWILGGSILISSIAFLSYSIIMGRKLCTLYELSEKGILKTIITKKDAELFLQENAENRPNIKPSLTKYMQFVSVIEVKENKKNNIIRLNSLIDSTTIVTNKEDYDFVLSYVTERTSKKQRLGLSDQ